MKTKAQLLAERKSVAEAARDIAAKAEAEGRELTTDEMATVTEHLNTIRSLSNDVKALDDAERIKADLDQLEQLDAATAGQLNASATAGAQLGVPALAGRSIGQMFAESAQLKALHEQFGGQIPDSAKGIRVNPVPVGGMKALLTGADADASAGTLLQSQFLGLQSMGVWQRPLRIRDLITVGTTGTDTVEFARVVSVTNSAAPVPEATISGPKPTPDAENTAGTKPESAMVFERVVTNVKTIAHWLAATKRALSDAGQLRTLIDTFLRYGLEEELEDQVIAGNGVGENLDGILETTGVQEQPFVDHVFDTVRKAITRCRVNGRAVPTGIALHPADDEMIDLQRDDNDRFFGNGPFGMGPSTIWGVPRVVTEAVPEGVAILGDWRQAVLWDRETATITATDSHEDFFVRNLVAILGELRAAFGIFKPQAFVAVEMAEGSG